MKLLLTPIYMRHDDIEEAKYLASVRFPIVEAAHPLNLTARNSADFGGLFGTPNAVHRTPSWYLNPHLVVSPEASISTQTQSPSP